MIPSNVIIKAARDAGFDLVGVVRADAMPSERNIFSAWLLEGCHSTLSYLERNVDKRFDSRLLVDGAHSVVVCAVSYLSPYSRGYAEGCNTKVASYALACDYHLTIKEMLGAVARQLSEYSSGLKFRAFTDSAPLAEKSLAVRAGLGWIGRNSLVVNPRYGSMFHLGELVISDKVDSYDEPLVGVGCGSCRRCVDACPNGAIRDDRSIDTRLCISCRTIEREGCTEPIELDGWIYGCDACQSVCPFNCHASEHSNSAFDPLFDPTTLDARAWLRMTEEEFQSLAGTTTMPRAGLARIKANIEKHRNSSGR